MPLRWSTRQLRRTKLRRERQDVVCRTLLRTDGLLNTWNLTRVTPRRASFLTDSIATSEREINGQSPKDPPNDSAGLVGATGD